MRWKAVRVKSRAMYLKPNASRGSLLLLAGAGVTILASAQADPSTGRISVLSFPQRVELHSLVHNRGAFYVVGYIDRLGPSREDAIVARHIPGERARTIAEVDSGLPGYKPAWKPTSPAFYRPDRFVAATRLSGGTLVAVGDQYNVPSRWGTVFGGGSSADMLILATDGNREVFRKRWKPSEKGYHDTLGLLVSSHPNGGFVLSGATALSTGPHVEPRLLRLQSLLHLYSAEGKLLRDMRFGVGSVPMAVSVSPNGQTCYVITRNSAAFGWEVGGPGVSLSRHAFDLATGRKVSSEQVFKG